MIFLMRFVVLAFFSVYLLTAEAANFTPPRTNDDLNNPHKGFMLWGTTAASGLPDNFYGSTVFHVYAPWRELETADQVFDFAGFELRHFQPILASNPNATFVLRIVADYPGGVGSGISDAYINEAQPERDYPGFLELAPLNIAGTDYSSCNGDGPGRTPDWNSPAFSQQANELIDALAIRYDGDPRITAIQVGLLGLWGEWHQSGCDSLQPQNAIKQSVRDRYALKFLQTPLQTRYPRSPDVTGVSFGFYEDYFPSFTANCIYGFPACDASGDWNMEWNFINANPGARDNWLSNPVSGESPLASQKETWINDRADIETVLRDYHFSFLGPAGKHETAGFATDLNYLKRVLGYNLHLDALSFPSPVAAGTSFNITATLANSGSAGLYHPYRLRLSLHLPGMGEQWFTVLNSSLDSVRPGSPLLISETVTLGALAANTYQLRAILESTTPGRPNVILQNSTRDSGGRLQLGNILVTSGEFIFGNGFE